MDKRFIAQVVHDMKSPLSVLRSFINCANTCIEESEDADLISLSQSASRSLTKLLGIVETLLTPTICPQRKLVDVAEIVCSIVNELKPMAELKGAEIVYTGAEHLCALVDPLMINRVISNLVINALQAMEIAQGMVRIGLFRRGDTIFVEVSDNGCGIGPEHIGKIFDYGFTFRKQDGTGLGLDFCRQVAKAHDGEINVYSIPGCGTAFTTSLPSPADSICAQEEYHTSLRENTLD